MGQIGIWRSACCTEKIALRDSTCGSVGHAEGMVSGNQFAETCNALL